MVTHVPPIKSRCNSHPLPFLTHRVPTLVKRASCRATSESLERVTGYWGGSEYDLTQRTEAKSDSDKKVRVSDVVEHQLRLVRPTQFAHRQDPHIILLIIVQVMQLRFDLLVGPQAREVVRDWSERRVGILTHTIGVGSKERSCGTSHRTDWPATFLHLKSSQLETAV